MDDHPPSWVSNGSEYLLCFGLTDKTISRINPFLLNAHKETIPRIDALSLAKGIVENFSLTSIELHRCGIGCEGAMAVAQALSCNKFLTFLGLSRNEIGSRGGIALAEALKVNQTLRTIDLSWNGLHDDFGASFAEAILVNNSLQRVLLDRNKIGRDGCGAIAAALNGNRKLRFLSLAQNKIQSGGCGLLGEALRRDNALGSLDIQMNGVPQEGMFALCRSLQCGRTSNLLSLNLGYNHVGDAIMVLGSFVEQASSLRELCLERTDLVASPALDVFSSALAKNSSLCCISFACNPLQSKGVETLCASMSRISSLRYVDFTDVGANNDSLQHLATLACGAKHLRVLHYGQNNVVGEEGGRGLGVVIQSSSSLEILTVPFCKLGCEGARAMFSAMRLHPALSVRTLNMRYCEITDSGFEPLMQLMLQKTHFQYIDVTGNSLTQKAISSLNDAFLNNPLLYSLILEDNTVVTRSNLYVPWAEVCGKAFYPADAPHPPNTNAPFDLSTTYNPTCAFATYSLTCGSMTRRQLEGSNNAKPSLLALVGKPVRACGAWDGEVASAAASLTTAAGVNLDYVVLPSDTARLENNIGKLLVSDDQMRREFNRLDQNGTGWLDKKEFRSIFRSYEQFGVHLSDAQLDAMLSEFKTHGDKLSFDEFCVIMLRMARY